MESTVCTAAVETTTAGWEATARAEPLCTAFSHDLVFSLYVCRYAFVLVKLRLRHLSQALTFLFGIISVFACVTSALLLDVKGAAG